MCSGATVRFVRRACTPRTLGKRELSTSKARFSTRLSVDGLSYLPSVVHTDRTCEAMSGWHSATAGSRVGATSILVANGVAALIGESGLAGEWSAVGKSA